MKTSAPSETPKPKFGILLEFRDFIMRGNLVELAVAFVAGAAFTAIVTSLVNNIVSPIIAIAGGKPDFRTSLILEINGAKILFGAFLTDVISFLITMAAVFFLIVKPLNALRRTLIREEASATPAEHELVTALKQVQVVSEGDTYRFEAKQ